MHPFGTLQWQPDNEGGVIARATSKLMLRVAPVAIKGQKVWQAAVMAGEVGPGETLPTFTVLAACFYSPSEDDAKRLIYSIGNLVEPDFPE